MLYIDWLQSLKQFFHECVISYTCSQSNSGGSDLSLKTEPSELDWQQVYDMTNYQLLEISYTSVPSSCPLDCGIPLSEFSSCDLFASVCWISVWVFSPCFFFAPICLFSFSDLSACIFFSKSGMYIYNRNTIYK